jgi:hypothetical protein
MKWDHPRSAAELTQEVDDEFARYFRGLGFTVTWDFSKKTGERWYEILDEDNALVAQVDFGTPLEEFLTDVPHFLAGQAEAPFETARGIGPTNYTCNATNSGLREILRRQKVALGLGRYGT